MKYYVYHNYGTCNQEDHSCGIEEFDTLEEALRDIEMHKDYMKRTGIIYANFLLLKGEEVQLISGDPDR